MPANHFRDCIAYAGHVLIGVQALGRSAGFKTARIENQSRFTIAPRTSERRNLRDAVPSLRLEGKQPRVANMLVEDHLQPAAGKAGILSSHQNAREQLVLVDDDPRRFGFHNLRHGLESFLIRIRTDPETVQTLLRHSDVKLTLQFYTHGQPGSHVRSGKMLTAILSHAADQSGLRAD